MRLPTLNLDIVEMISSIQVGCWKPIAPFPFKLVKKYLAYFLCHVELPFVSVKSEQMGKWKVKSHKVWYKALSRQVKISSSTVPGNYSSYGISWIESPEISWRAKPISPSEIKKVPIEGLYNFKIANSWAGLVVLLYWVALTTINYRCPIISFQTWKYKFY